MLSHCLCRAVALLICLGLLAPSGRVAGTPVAAAERPNVIVILTDDQGSVDLGCYGAEDLVTPHIDRIAQRGVRFTQFYAAAPVCSPSRAGLLTGRYPLWLSNLADDPGERTNLADKHPQIVQRLTALHEAETKRPQ